MFIALIIAAIVGFAVISMAGGTVKKVMEVISSLLRLGLGGVITMLLCKAVGVDFSQQGRLFLYCCIGALVFFVLLTLLASMFRMISYSINFFTVGIFLALLSTALGDKLQLGVVPFAIIWFLLPRILWISDRFATTTDYTGSDYDPWTNTQTYFYAIRPMDWWGNSEESWKWLPFQIVVSSLFYLLGCAALFSLYPISAQWLSIVIGIVAIAANVLFDLFVFRRIDERIDRSAA